MEATAPGYAMPKAGKARHAHLLAWLALSALLIFALALAAGRLISEPLRRRIESELNQTVTGYTVSIPTLRFQPWSFSLTLVDASVRQAAHPEPPVLTLPSLFAGVHWRALLHGRLVADFLLDSPHLHINLPQLEHEASDKVPLKDKGWQDTLEKIYPLKVNQFRIRNATLTYVDDDTEHPLVLRQTNFLATNVRNIESPDRAYPSPIHLDAVVFDGGRLRVDGAANFLAVPQPGIKAEVEVSKVPLRHLKPVTQHANVYVTGGTLAALGEVEFAPKIEQAHLHRVTVDDVTVDYVHSPETAAAEAEHVDKTERTAGEVTDKPGVLLAVDQVVVKNATFGYVDQTRQPNFRLFVAKAGVDLQGVSNRADAGPMHLTMDGAFMGSGATRVDVSLQPRRSHPDLDLAVDIEPTQMTTMNNLLRTYGNFDVVAGEFSFYSQLHIKEGRIDGYVKPLFTGLKVYDRRQDRDKPLFQQIYEGLVGGVAGLLENRSRRVATQVTVSGPSEAPQTSTWEVLSNLLYNAYVKSIVPGFEHSVREASQSPETTAPPAGQ